MVEICKTDVLLDQLSGLAMNASYSDVTFVVHGEKIPAHRAILAARSEYFRGLLYGDFAESQQHEVELDVPLEAFKLMLNYIYTGRMVVDLLDADNIIEIFDLVHLYGFTELELEIAEHLQCKISVETALWTRHLAALYNLSELLAVCDRFIDGNAELILQHNSFNTATEDCVQTILQRDSFVAKEIDIFTAIKKWCEHHPNVDVAAMLSKVRLSLIDTDDLLNIILPTGLVDDKVVLNAIKDQRNKNNLPHRAELPKQPEYIWDGTCYDLKNKYTINCIKAKLDAHEVCSYYVEVSKDNIEWNRVIDYSEYDCSSYQNLYFPSRVVRFIRFTKKQNENLMLCYVKELEVMHTEQLVNMISNLIISPIHNVACPNMGAAIVIDGNFNHLDGWNINFNNGKKSFINCYGHTTVRLAQPYYIDSIRFRLSNLDNRCSFSIQTWSRNGYREDAISETPVSNVINHWCHFRFTPRIVKIIQFQIDQFVRTPFRFELQCPSEEPAYLEEQKRKLLQCQRF